MKYNNDQMIIIRQVIVYEICMCTFACCKYVIQYMIYMCLSHTYTQKLDILFGSSWPCLNGIYILSYFRRCGFLCEWVVTSFLGYFYFFNVMHLISIKTSILFLYRKNDKMIDEK